MKKNLLSSFMLFAAATLFVSCDPVTPEPTPPVPTTDVAITAKHAFGSYLEDGKKEGYANFNLVLSEVKGTHDLKFEAAGQALVLSLYAPISEKMELPAGKYTSLTDVATVAGPSVVTNLTNGFTIDADKKSTKTHSFKSMELTVAGTGDSYTITFNGTTTGDTKYTCTYTAGKIAMTDITAASTDVAIDAKHAFGFYDEDGKKEGYANFRVALSDVKGTNELKFEAAGQALLLNLYAPINEKMELAVGKYTALTDAAMVVAGPSVVTDRTKGITIDAELVNKEAHSFKTIELEVAGTSESYTITFNGVTTEDIAYSCTYTGKIDMTNGTETPEPEPIVIKNSIVEYWGGRGVSEYSLIMTNCTVDADGKYTSAGTRYTVKLYSARPSDPTNWRPAAGQYAVSTEDGVINTFYRNGSSATSIEDNNGEFKPNWGKDPAIGGGIVTIAHVEGSATGFTATLDVSLMSGSELVPLQSFTAGDFVRVDKTVEPEEPVEPEFPQTTFTGDVVLALDATSATAVYTDLGDVRSWRITIGDDSNTSYKFDMTIYDDGLTPSPTDLPVAQFMAGEADVYAPGTFAPGLAADYGMAPTSYEVATDPEAETPSYAAINGGDITIAKESDGEYTFTFAVKDALMNEFTGTWKGAVAIAEYVDPWAVKRK